MRFSTFLLKQVIGLFILLGLMASCYRMPAENEFSTIPMTNNPSVTCEKPAMLPIPKAGY